jgi:hypothetical protein
MGSFETCFSNLSLSCETLRGCLDACLKRHTTPKVRRPIWPLHLWQKMCGVAWRLRVCLVQLWIFENLISEISCEKSCCELTAVKKLKTVWLKTAISCGFL